MSKAKVRFPEKRIIEVMEGDFELTVPISQSDWDRMLHEFKDKVLKLQLESPMGDMLVFHNLHFSDDE